MCIYIDFSFYIHVYFNQFGHTNIVKVNFEALLVEEDLRCLSVYYFRHA
jgi:hypothetical protein